MAKDIELYKRRLAREINARKQAEALIEKKSLELFYQAQARELALLESEERYRSLVESSPDAILIECEGSIVFANKAALHLFHAKSIDDLQNCTIISLAAPAYRPKATAIIHALEQGKNYPTMEEEALRLDAEVVPVAVTRLLFHYQGKRAIHMVVRDISERKEFETRLHFQASHDALTGLPNRILLVDRLDFAIAKARRDHGRFMVSFIDLDRFKWINDSWGHDVGDTVLKTISERISSCLRETDMIARIGGDEFVLLLQDSSSENESLLVLRRVMESITQNMTISGHQIAITCSVGCSVYPDDGNTAEALLRFSDAAMYRAKEMGRNNMQLYDMSLRSRINERVKLRTDLRYALERKELTLHYQLQVDLQTRNIRGVEALLRWQHPELGNIAPSRFIPIAEETGLIQSIGEWVLQHACMQNKLWQKEGITPLPVAVNLSARQLSQPGFETKVAESLALTQLDPACLELELTESASMDDPDKTLSLMRKIKELGVALSIDDFGTGYSNMQYLQRFPVEKLKIDGSFIRDITQDPGSLTIADAIISLAHRLSMKVVAEMAETKSQIEILADCSCDQVQGYYFSRPVPAHECAKLLLCGYGTASDSR